MIKVFCLFLKNFCIIEVYIEIFRDEMMIFWVCFKIIQGGREEVCGGYGKIGLVIS